MSSIKVQINQSLSKITTYELNRDSDRVEIHLHEVISAHECFGKVNKYVAIPYLMFHNAKNDFCFAGSTPDDVLKRCVEAVSDNPLSEIFEEKPH